MKKQRDLYLISCRNEEGKYEHFSVPYEVSVYIKQLECYINHPKESGLKRTYPRRFNNAIEKLQEKALWYEQSYN